MNWRTIITILSFAALGLSIYFDLTQSGNPDNYRGVMEYMHSPLGVIFFMIACVGLIIAKQINKK